jgi:hypothetical protein
VCGALTGLVVELQLPAAPETTHVTVPVGAGRVFEPVIVARKVIGCPTVGLDGKALMKILGVACPNVSVLCAEVAVK